MNEPMTDYQFKTILKMVLNMLKSTDNIEEAREAISKLLGEEEK